MKWIIGVLLLVIAAGSYWHWITTSDDPTIDVPWEYFVTPGPLTTAHDFLENDCRSCHSPVTGIERMNCVWCHASETTLLGRQPTSFHAEISECTGCHTEHQGREANLNQMDHNRLASIGIATLQQSASKDGPLNGAATQLQLLEIHTDAALDRGINDTALDCASCHSTKDRHAGLMGNDCAQCHNFDNWTIDAFQHPSASNTECNQCHQAPPSHYMEHFKMISQGVARKPRAVVVDCFECHQTTSWNDIEGIGFYKHH